MTIPDAHTRNRISLEPTRILPSSLPSKLISRLVLTDTLYVVSLYATKAWLLGNGVGVFWVLMRLFACAGIGVLVWEARKGALGKKMVGSGIEWSLMGTASLLQFIRYGSLFVGLYRLPSPRVILFAHSAQYILPSMLSFSSCLLTTLAFLVPLITSTKFEALGYAALILHAISTFFLDRNFSVLSPLLGMTVTQAATLLGATIFALPLYLLRTLITNASSPALPLLPLLSLPLIAYSLLLLTPLTNHTIAKKSLQIQHFNLVFPSLLVLSVVASLSLGGFDSFGKSTFDELPKWSDGVVASLLYLGLQPSFKSSRLTTQTLQTFLKPLLSTPDSKKITSFLLLNLLYMLIQLLYGVYTNSLGLISDAIHMFFDCLAIAVGLGASVMGRWGEDERYSFGYGRVETLSGFGNGIFLVLISGFIVFEAIQRILDPPEMNTSQLLLVSSVGLAVNLFGMFAMGGHHHHGGHGHSHSHSHDSHGHSHSLSWSMFGLGGREHHDDHSHEHHLHGTSEHGHSHEHAHGHSHDHGHGHECQHEQEHEKQHIIISPPVGLDDHSHDRHHHCGDNDENRKESDCPYEDGGRHHHLHSHDHDHGHGHGEGQAHHSHSHLPKRPQAPKAIPSISVELANSLGGGEIVAASAGIRGEFGSGRGKERFGTPITPGYTFGYDRHLDEVHGVGQGGDRNGVEESRKKEKGHSSHNMRGVFLHVMADTLGSVGVILSTLLINAYGWTGFDPIASLFIAVLIAGSVAPLVMDTGRVLALDIGKEKANDVKGVLEEIEKINGLHSYSRARFWPKDSSSVIGSIHIKIEPWVVKSHRNHDDEEDDQTRGIGIDALVQKVEKVLKEGIEGLEEVTVQVEVFET